jgi:ribosomal protein L28
MHELVKLPEKCNVLGITVSHSKSSTKRTFEVNLTTIVFLMKKLIAGLL